ncbi:MAG: CPBP family intramembrane metalloprotease [Oscillospiraceae bacterium]|nr:CPBP family intramembrane metalloprotease [Oscillospiraceae bacterium]
MKSTLADKLKKCFVLALIFLAPKFCIGMYLKNDFGISSLLSIILIFIFMRQYNRPAIAEQKENIKRTSPLMLAGIAICSLFMRLAITYFSIKEGTMPVDENWLNVNNIVNVIILSPIVEEMFFRWGLAETCINSKTKMHKKVIFIICSILLWELCHKVLLNITLEIMGLLMILIYLKSKNITYTIVFHFVSNLVYVLFTSTLQNKLGFLVNSKAALAVNLTVFAVSAAMILISLFRSSKRIQKLVTDTM